MGVKVDWDGCLFELVQPTETYIILFLREETFVSFLPSLMRTFVGPSYGTSASDSDFGFFFKPVNDSSSKSIVHNASSSTFDTSVERDFVCATIFF